MEENRPLRVIISINGQKFRVPCSRSPENSIGWLCNDVARRYERHNKLATNSVNVSEIRGRDGSVLDSSDLVVDACDDMEELVGILEHLSVALRDRSLSSLHASHSDHSIEFPSSPKSPVKLSTRVRMNSVLRSRKASSRLPDLETHQSRIYL